MTADTARFIAEQLESDVTALGKLAGRIIGQYALINTNEFRHAALRNDAGLSVEASLRRMDYFCFELNRSKGNLTNANFCLPPVVKTDSK